MQYDVSIIMLSSSDLYTQSYIASHCSKRNIIKRSTISTTMQWKLKYGVEFQCLIIFTLKLCYKALKH